MATDEQPAKRFKAIAAMAQNRVIGNGPDIPWHLPEDFKFFKATTTGHVVVMGRKTFESIGRPLPNRETIIVSRRRYEYIGVRTVCALEEIDVNADARDYFICGGGQLYAEALPLCSDLYLTHVHRVVDGDVFFPPFESLFDAGETINTLPDFDIVHYRRRPDSAFTR
jgi:dihydrofolate reductase